MKNEDIWSIENIVSGAILLKKLFTGPGNKNTL